MRNLKLRLLSNVVVAYMLIAFVWWSVLLYTKNNDAFVAKANSLQLIMAAEGDIQNLQEFENTAQYQELAQQYKRQEWMIFGEALFFVISLAVGIYLINRGYHKEIIAAQERRNFLLSITHELKSPIASIRLVLDTFLKRQLQNTQIQQLSRTGIEEAERLTVLVEDLLLAAKLETSYQPNLDNVDVDATLTKTVQRLEKKFETRDLQLRLPPTPTQIQADKAGFDSIVINLIENAAKYSPKGTPISIKLTKDKNMLKIITADQGYGIPVKEKKKIFQKFYRIGNEDTRSTKGTGLGLYIVKEIVEAHHGKITVEDNDPKGTRFIVTLPLQA